MAQDFKIFLSVDFVNQRSMLVVCIVDEQKMEEPMPQKTRQEENSKFSLWHEIIIHREVLVDRITDQKNFNEGYPPLRLLSQLSI